MARKGAMRFSEDHALDKQQRREANHCGSTRLCKRLKPFNTEE